MEKSASWPRIRRDILGWPTLSSSAAAICVRPLIRSVSVMRAPKVALT